jgi:hypothetical protein
MRERRDPLQKSEDLIAHMQWCDEGSLEACLHAGHVLLFNECLFDRGYALYVAGQALARDLPAAAIDDSTVDGRPLRAELQLGLRMGDPANRDEQQVQAIARVCGAVAERDRPWWDEVFAGYQRGERTPETTPSTDMESVALGAIRKELLMGAETRIATLESLAGGAAGGLRLTLARVAGELCASDDPVSCATAAYLQGGACRLDEMTAAYRAFETGLSRLDPRSRELAFNLGRDVTWQARAYVEADERTRDELRRSICARH